MNATRNESNPPERDIFLDVIEIEDLREREAFLDKVCDGNPILRASVVTLLEHHKEDEFMQTVISPNSTAEINPPAKDDSTFLEEKIGDKLSVYKILQKIGEGGVGMVYLAEQEEPVRRRVALKVLKPGLETKTVIARFKSESQALALMDHPNIARVLDAGSANSGRPFFVMDLVRGTRITDYCDDQKLSTGERLSLFVQVCHAIQHAHQKGVIHRDIKPSNVLVTLHDGKPVPKVIDFGIAKATEQKLTDQTVLTEFHSFMGTPAYVSPEQAEMSGLDIDTRADIYSLGVLLYELLTGKTPFDPSDLAASGLEGMRRTIRESEPMKPSTKIRTMQAVEQTTTASRQRLEPSKLTSLLQGDLDWIILKTLEKDRTRRYETANALAMDIERYLANQPVLARPPSTAYRIQKFIRRNKVTSAAVVAFTGALTIGLGFTTWQWKEKSEAYQRIALSEKIEKGLRQQATTAKEVAETQAKVNKRRAYASDMNLAHQALQMNNLGRARELLERYLPDKTSINASHIEPDFRGWEWRYLWEKCKSDALFDLCQVSEGIVALSTSNDGHWVAIGKQSNDEISVWDLRSREQVTRLHQARFSAPFHFSPTAPLLAFVTKNTLTKNAEEQPGSVVSLWDGETRQTVGKLTLEGRCAAMAFAEDGSRLITVTDNLMVTQWDMNGFLKLESHRLEGPSIPPGRFGFGPTTISSNLEYVAYAMGQGNIRALNLSTGETLLETKAADERITELAFSPDGSVLASSGGFVESSIRLWDIQAGNEIARLENHRTFIQSLMFWPDGKRLASASGDQTIQLWDLDKINQFKDSVTAFVTEGHQWDPLIISQPMATFKGHKDEVWSLTLSPDTETLISGGKDGIVSVWDTNLRSEEKGPVILPVAVKDWGFTQDCKSILTFDNQGRVKRWHGDQFLQQTLLLNFDSNAEKVLFSPNSEFVAVNQSNERIEIWDLNQRTLKQRIGSVDTPEIPIAFVGPMKHLISLQVGIGTFRKWDLESGVEIETWTIYAPQSSGSVMFSSSGLLSLQIFGEHAGNLRNMDTGNQIKLDLDLRQFGRGAFSPDDRFVTLVSALGVGKVWETKTGNLAATIRGFLQGQHSAAFSPNSDRMAIASNAREAVKLWDTDGFLELITLEGNGSLFMNVAFSPDGNVVASSNWDGALHIWQVPTLDNITEF